MKKQSAFTLIEILIALAVFATIAAITSSSLFYAFATRTRVNAQADQLNNLQLAISIMQQDITQATPRAIRGNDMHLFPAFIGQSQYLELTRDGDINPKSFEKRSTLKRIALLCQGNNLIHRTWPRLDAVKKESYEDKILLNNVLKCHFNYLNQDLQILNEWREQAITTTQPAAIFPKAIQINLVLQAWGELNLLFAIPGALYAPS